MEMHTQRGRVWASPLVRWGEVKRWAVKSFISGRSSRSLSSFRPVIWFLFLHLTYPGTLPWVCTPPSAKMDLQVKASGRSIVNWHCLLTFDPQGAFWCMCNVSLVPKEGDTEIP